MPLWWMLTNSTSERLRNASAVPLPWWTSQSSTKTRETPSCAIASSAAIATLLNRQNPIARSGSAWWPEGRTPQKPSLASPASSALVISHAAPAACLAARNEGSPTAVSASIAPPPAGEAEIANGLHERRRVDQLQLGLVGRRRQATLEPEPAALLQRALDRVY